MPVYTIQGTPVQTDSAVRLYPSGALRAANLLAPVELTAGGVKTIFTNVSLDRHGVDYRDINIPWDAFDIYFFENGAVKAASLMNDTLFPVNGGVLPIQRGDYFGASFYRTGAFASGHLSEDATLEIEGRAITFKKGERIYARETGEIEAGTLAKPATVRGIWYPAGAFVAFYDITYEKGSANVDE